VEYNFRSDLALEVGKPPPPHLTNLDVWEFAYWYA